jgi:hypothetical protein
LSHLWQRFLLATALVFGLALGVAATIFGYSNTATVSVGWSVFHVESIPLWTVAVVPLVIVLVAGTVYHWFNSLHHFTEHMRHRRRVHELEAELTSMRAHLDRLLEMPDRTSPSKAPALAEPKPVETPALPEPAAAVVANGDGGAAKKSRKRGSAAVVADTEPVAETASEPTPETEPSPTGPSPIPASGGTSPQAGKSHLPIDGEEETPAEA